MWDRGSAVRGKWAEIFRGGGSCIEEKKRSFWKLQGGFLGFGGQGGEDFQERFLGVLLEREGSLELES